MLRKARIILSVVIFGLITFYFLDFAEILPNSFHRLAHIQFVPALMSLSFIILVVLVLITLLWTYLLLYNLPNGYLSGHSDLDF